MGRARKKKISSKIGKLHKAASLCTFGAVHSCGRSSQIIKKVVEMVAVVDMDIVVLELLIVV